MDKLTAVYLLKGTVIQYISSLFFIKPLLLAAVEKLRKDCKLFSIIHQVTVCVSVSVIDFPVMKYTRGVMTFCCIWHRKYLVQSTRRQ